jgi:hypothetical protein
VNSIADAGGDQTLAALPTGTVQHGIPSRPGRGCRRHDKKFDGVSTD